MAGWLAGRPEPVVVNYHSITPPAYFGPWNNGITRLQVGAQFELAHLAPRAALGIAVSRFDEAELRRGRLSEHHGHPGGQRVRPAGRTGPRGPGPAVDPADRKRGHRWLSVGRLAPNKCHHQTIAAALRGPALDRPRRRPDAGGGAVGAGLRRRPPGLRRVAGPGRLSRVRDRHLRRRSGRPLPDVPTSWSCCPSTRGSACPWWRPWARDFPSWPSTPGRSARCSADAGCCSSTRDHGRWPTPWPGCCADPDERERLVAAGKIPVRDHGTRARRGSAGDGGPGRFPPGGSRPVSRHSCLALRPPGSLSH